MSKRILVTLAGLLLVFAVLLTLRVEAQTSNPYSAPSNHNVSVV